MIEKPTVAALMTQTFPAPGLPQAAELIADTAVEVAAESMPTFEEVLSSVTLEQAMGLSDIAEEESSRTGGGSDRRIRSPIRRGAGGSRD